MMQTRLCLRCRIDAMRVREYALVSIALVLSVNDTEAEV